MMGMLFVAICIGGILTAVYRIDNKIIASLKKADGKAEAMMRGFDKDIVKAEILASIIKIKKAKEDKE